MARGRLIWRTLGSSRRYARLGRELNGLGEFAQALYPLLVTHADDYGREEGDAYTVKTRVFPSSPRTEDEFETALLGMERVNLIQRYAAGRQHVLQIVDYKQDLRRKMPSQFPSCMSSTEDSAADTNRSDSDHDSDSDTNRTEGALRDRFERWWGEYPRKIGKDAAWREWLHRCPDDALTECMMAAVQRHKASPQWRKDGGQFIPHPRTWLHQGRWQDEVGIGRPPPKADDDWYEECGRLHNHECELNRLRHFNRMALEAMKAGTA